MFYKCISLNNLPDISKWETKGFTNISYMLSCCESLKSLPDISKWDIQKVIDMEMIFYECTSLICFVNR